jgi:hypothetical protein
MSRGQARCTVALWRGYVSGCFYARPPETDVALFVSPSFRIVRLPWRPEVPLHEDPAVIGALKTLEETLVAQGWQRTRRAPRSGWYELRFKQAPRDESRGGPDHRDPRAVRQGLLIPLARAAAEQACPIAEPSN